MPVKIYRPKKKSNAVVIDSYQRQIDSKVEQMPKEYGGRDKGLEATRYGDWELKGRCVDF